MGRYAGVKCSDVVFEMVSVIVDVSSAACRPSADTLGKVSVDGGVVGWEEAGVNSMLKALSGGSWKLPNQLGAVGKYGGGVVHTCVEMPRQDARGEEAIIVAWWCLGMSVVVTELPGSHGQTDARST